MNPPNPSPVCDRRTRHEPAKPATNREGVRHRGPQMPQGWAGNPMDRKRTKGLNMPEIHQMGPTQTSPERGKLGHESAKPI